VSDSKGLFALGAIMEEFKVGMHHDFLYDNCYHIAHAPLCLKICVVVG